MQIISCIERPPRRARFEYNPDLTVIVGDFMEGRRIVKQEWRNLRQRFDTDDLLLCFTDTTNFRKNIDPDYKGSRKDKESQRATRN